MWHVLAESKSVGEALERLQGEYDVDSGQLAQDLDDFIDQLVKMELVALEK